MKLPANKPGALEIRRVLSSLKTLPRYLLLQRVYALEITILILGLVIGLYFITRLLFLEPATSTTDTTDIPRLSTSIIDALELWIEEREAARTTTPPVGDRDYFVTPQQL